MVGFLGLVGALSYLLAAFAFISAFNASDIQIILSGVFATCGTVAIAGAAMLHRLGQIANDTAVIRANAATEPTAPPPG